MLTELNETRLSLIHPIVASKARGMIVALVQQGVSVLVTQGLRTWAEQDALYAVGRTKPGKIVTKARGGESWHNFGLAFDIVILDSVGKADWNTAHPGWMQASLAGQAQGLAWGGDWKKFKDIPHYEYTCHLTLADARVLFDVGGLEAVWARIS